MPTPFQAALWVANATLVAAIAAIASWPTTDEPLPAYVPPTAWAPPAWFPEDSRDPLWVLPQLDETPRGKGPRVRARSALVADLDRGEVLWTHNPDDRRPVASLTKMVSGLALASENVDLDRALCVSPEQYPSRSGARSRFETGMCHTGWEFLGAALVGSDNRGAMGFPALADLEYHAFIQRMHDVSAELGLDEPSWADPAGLEDDNIATARDMLKAVVAVAAHPDLSAAASARAWRLDRRRGPQWVGTTNRLIHHWETVAAKTGYTDTAGWCFATVVRTRSGRTLAAVALGSRTKASRFDDVRAMVRWAESQ